MVSFGKHSPFDENLDNLIVSDILNITIRKNKHICILYQICLYLHTVCFHNFFPKNPKSKNFGIKGAGFKCQNKNAK